MSFDPYAPPFTSAVELAAALRRGEVGPVEVLDAYLARVDERDGELGTFVHRADDEARAAAREAADRLAAAGSGDVLPPFLGVPLPVKDLADVAGWPTAGGVVGIEPRMPAEDSLVVRRLREAGFVLMGKTATPEFGTISFTEHSSGRVTRNPWDPSRTPGGSSGGAGAAVAAGFAPLAHGSDGGGSIRIPASCNGLVGLKPSRGRVSNALPELEGLATQGVLTRTVADTAALLDVLSAPDPLAWYEAPRPLRPYRSEVGADLGRLRVAVTTRPAVDLPVDPACVEAVERTAGALAELGHEVLPDAVEWPAADDVITSFTTIWNTISADTGVPVEVMEPHNRALAAAARATDSIAYVEAVKATQRLTREVRARWGRDWDLVLLPTMAVEPPPVGAVWAMTDLDPMMPLLNCYPMAVFTSVWNVTGLPAVSLPVQVAPSGLPVGVQLVAGPWADDVLIRVAARLETVFGWPSRHP